ncbi:hypothetical protein F5Y07DRAFT_408057 [Xylaria sp. FL0933]|nr:hypothetical protein F5Y07DRAFT_408057 [Xylaria sp. FL0933]
MPSDLYVRKPYKEPWRREDVNEVPPEIFCVRFYHPCEPLQNPILRLHAFEHSQLSLSTAPPEHRAPTIKWGVHHQTARIACSILACNRWDGYFSSARDRTKIDESEELLTENDYLFIVPGPENYPVVEDFRSWPFPRDNLPPSWNFTIPSTPGQDAQGDPTLGSACAVTNAGNVLQHYHIVPTSERSWFATNHMGGDQEPVNSMGLAMDITANCLTVRADIGKLFEDNRICIVPKTAMLKPDGVPTYCIANASSRSVNLVLHVLFAGFQSPTELYKQYHNVSLHQLRDISPDYLFAAFAKGIFLRCSYFQADNREREAITLDTSGACPRLIAYTRKLSAETINPTREDRLSMKRPWSGRRSDSCDGTDDADAGNRICDHVRGGTSRQSEDRGPASRRLDREVYTPASPGYADGL